MQDLADRLPPRLGRTVRRMVAVKLTYSAIATLILPLTFLMVVIFRYVLHRDLFAYEEWLLPISFWLYFMASAVATYQDTQIRADVLESLFRTPRSIWIRRICLTAIEMRKYGGCQMPTRGESHHTHFAWVDVPGFGVMPRQADCTLRIQHRIRMAISSIAMAIADNYTGHSQLVCPASDLMSFMVHR